MKNQQLDSKILSIPSRNLASKIPILFGFLFVMLFVPQLAFADVYIPLHEYLGYFDSNGIYTVVGNVKNTNNFGVVPTITVSVIDDSKTISKIINHVPLGPEKEIPFKIKFPELLSNTPILVNPEITFQKAITHEIPIQILYDKTLIKYNDGHITGRIQNTGDQTIFYPKIYAVVHGYENVLDITQNIEFIEKIEPGEILDFSMYPDPAITQDVFYYSCFAPVDTTVIPITAKKNDGNFDFRYDSGAWYSAAKFDESGTTLSIRGYNSYPLETYANFEFPPISGNEKFSVTLNDEPVDFIQSIDEMGFWHVAFTVGPTSQGTLKISGFDKGLPPEMPKIPQWIKTNADWWVNNQISDSEFLEGIDFLFEKQIASVPERDVIAESQWDVPSWVKISTEWWHEEKISDDEFLNIIENLVKRKIIVI
ncbi:peptidase [Nitrosopumilus oxyclinae]|uniref:Peptidase n=2 Tax=Nitrosopumilus oxyclinae TaxID=1959104 RepID=A0A7D5M5V4_9ARCH|nr:peptidase [Nitrosopumilus oxyclinae]